MQPNLSDFLGPLFSFSIPSWIWPVAIFLFFGLFVYLGTGVADFLNRLMMVGLVIAYVILIGLGSTHISAAMLTHFNWNFLLPSVSVVLTTFGYHIIIPTLTTYLEHDKKLLKRAIFIGSLIPFLVYVIWQCLVMGSLPISGEYSLSGRPKWVASDFFPHNSHRKSLDEPCPPFFCFFRDCDFPIRSLIKPSRLPCRRVEN